MKDRSTAGKMYRGGWSGRDIRTGLSRRIGGRWSGSLVYNFTCSPGTTTGAFIQGKKTLTCALPTCFVASMLRLIGVGLDAHMGICPLPFGGPSLCVRLGGGRGRFG